MMEVKEAARDIYFALDDVARDVLYGNATLTKQGNSSVYAIKKDIIAQALNRIQYLCNTCTTTPDSEFNKLAHKLLATAGTLLYYYYQRKDSYMDQYTFLYKFGLDLKSINNVAKFFYNKFVMGWDCYLVMIETDVNDLLMVPMKESSSSHPKDTFANMPICLFDRGEVLKIKRDTDEEYQCFNYSPSQLISTVKFSIVDNKISGVIDNSKWTDAAWSL